MRAVGKEKQGGEAMSPPGGWVQNSQGGCGRGPRSGSGLPWQVCSQWCAREGEEEVQVREDRGASTVCRAGLALWPPKVSQLAQRWSGPLWRSPSRGADSAGSGSGISPVPEAAALGWRAAAAAFFEVESVSEDEAASDLGSASGSAFDSGAARAIAFWASEVVVPMVWEGSQVAPFPLI